MAQTYTAAAIGITFAANKSMITIFNGSGSGRVVRVYRMWILNNQVTAVSGVYTTFKIHRLTGSTGGTPLTPIKHDTNSENLPSQITVTTGATDTLSDALRQIIWSNDEPTVGTGSVDELECLPPLVCVWDAGYGDTNVEPLTLREGQGVTIRHTGSTTVGLCDLFIEFTVAST